MKVPAGGPVGASEPELAVLLHVGPFHAAFRAAIRERGLTLQRLQARLARRGIRLALSSLSDWQHGHRRPGSESSLRAVEALEEILGLSGHPLLRLLVEPSSNVAPLRPRDGIDERSGDLGRLLDDLPGSRERALEVLFAEETVVVDANRRTASLWRRSLVRCLRAGTERYVLRYFGDAGCQVDRLRLGGLENCRVGRVLRHPSGVLV